MTEQEALDQLQTLIESADVEITHIRADEILCELLESCGFDKVVKAWNLVPKWYS